MPANETPIMSQLVLAKQLLFLSHRLLMDKRNGLLRKFFNTKFKEKPQNTLFNGKDSPELMIPGSLQKIYAMHQTRSKSINNKI